MNGFLPKLLELLEKEKIPYLVLRNYENLPEKPLEGSDVDILINKEDEKRYSEILKNAVLESGSLILFRFRQSNCLSFFVYQKKPFPLGTWVDAFWEISTKGFKFANENYLLKKRIRHKKNFFIPPPGGEAATLFLKDILTQGFIKERYLLKIPSLVRKDEIGFVKTLEPYFDPKIIKQMLEICLKEKWKEAMKKRNEWLKILILNNLLKNPINQTMHFFDFVFSQFKKIFTQKGLIVAFVGPDGVGKTTISDGLAEKFKNLFFKRVKKYHGHFGFFPELGEIYKFFFKKQFSENSILQEKPMGFFRAILHIFYYGLENFLSWPYFIFLKIKRNLIIFDRYFYDFFATNVSYKISFWLFFFILQILPRPDILFILLAKPETIYQRKQDLSLNEIKRQLNAFQNPSISKLTSTVFIDCEKNPEEILNEIEGIILEFFSQKYGTK